MLIYVDVVSVCKQPDIFTKYPAIVMNNEILHGIKAFLKIFFCFFLFVSLDYRMPTKRRLRVNLILMSLFHNWMRCDYLLEDGFIRPESSPMRLNQWFWD